MTLHVDTLVLGAGAAGLFCAARAGARGRRVLVLDHARKPAEKIRISGGGRCNFSNLETSASCFISANPHFAKSALARYTVWDFCALMAEHGLTWHEKTLGQLFCDQKSGAVIELLLSQLSSAGGQLKMETEIKQVQRSEAGFMVETDQGLVSTESLVIATGGKSIPKMGASGLAFEIAEQFGHTLIAPRAALVPLTFSGALKDAFASLAGVSLPVEARAQTGPSFVENILFTHRGLSGPAILQISSYWQPGEAIEIDLLPGEDLRDALLTAKSGQPSQKLFAFLATCLPKRFAEYLCTLPGLEGGKRLGDYTNVQLEKIAQRLKRWTVTPTGSEGWRTAEVTVGGVDTALLSSRTLESKIVPGLYFIGECVDVTGWLGGYNFQWAWASAAAAGETA